jgi:excisionase family DNA binding protein
MTSSSLPASRREIARAESLAERLLTATQVAAYLAVHRSTVYRLAGAPGGIPCVEIAGAVRFRPADVRSYVERHTVRDAGFSRVDQLLRRET